MLTAIWIGAKLGNRIGETLGGEDWQRGFWRGDGEGKEEEEEEEEEQTALIKSNNCHLAGGRKNVKNKKIITQILGVGSRAGCRLLAHHGSLTKHFLLTKNKSLTRPLFEKPWNRGENRGALPLVCLLWKAKKILQRNRETANSSNCHPMGFCSQPREMIEVREVIS